MDFILSAREWVRYNEGCFPAGIHPWECDTMRPEPVGGLASCLSFAESIAREAGELTLSHFRSPLEVEWKMDRSPVTIADRETEQFLRASIGERFPDHAILGEEFGEVGQGPWRWVLDPIDGTQSFIRGIPLYTVLVALLWDGMPILGVIHHPASGETVAAARGLGCRANGSLCQVSVNRELENAWVSVTDMADLAHRRPVFARELAAKAGNLRGWGDGYGYMLLATGRIDAMVDAVMNPWDLACLQPILEEAGGRFGNLAGEPTIHGMDCLASNGWLHPALLDLAAGDGIDSSSDR